MLPQVKSNDRHYWIEDWSDERVLEEAIDLLGIDLFRIESAYDDALQMMIEAFTRVWQFDVAHPQLVYGPYLRRENDPNSDKFEVSVLVRDEEGIPELKISVPGSDLVLMTAHAVVIFDIRVREERSEVLVDKTKTLSKGETFRLQAIDALLHDEQGSRVFHWALYKVWGREQTLIAEGVHPLLPNVPSPEVARTIVQVLCTAGPEVYIPEVDYDRFRRIYGPELLQVIGNDEEEQQEAGEQDQLG